MDKIAIFCSASDNIDPVYFDKARELGTWMGQNGKTLIYGGANIGLMECVARAAKENGSMVMGGVSSTDRTGVSGRAALSSTAGRRRCRRGLCRIAVCAGKGANDGAGAGCGRAGTAPNRKLPPV